MPKVTEIGHAYAQRAAHLEKILGVTAGRIERAFNDDVTEDKRREVLLDLAAHLRGELA